MHALTTMMQGYNRPLWLNLHLMHLGKTKPNQQVNKDLLVAQDRDIVNIANLGSLPEECIGAHQLHGLESSLFSIEVLT